MRAEHKTSSALWRRADLFDGSVAGIVNGIHNITGWEISEFDSDSSVLTPDLRWYRIRDTMFTSIEFYSEVRISFRPAPGTHVIVAPLSGVADIALESDRVEVTPGIGVALSDADQPAVRLSADCRLSVLHVHTSALAKGLGEADADDVAQPLRLHRHVDLGNGRGRSWHRLWRFLLDEFDRPGILAQTPWEAQRLEHLLLAMLMRAQPHNRARPGAGWVNGRSREFDGVADVALSYPSYLRKALQLIQEHPEWEHTIGSLAREAAVSERALQRRFRKHLGISPTTFMRNMRLDRVYESLRLASPHDVTIDQIARHWGFDNHGRFARRYRQRFNEAPSETLRRG